MAAPPPAAAPPLPPAAAAGTAGAPPPALRLPFAPGSGPAPAQLLTFADGRERPRPVVDVAALQHVLDAVLGGLHAAGTSRRYDSNVRGYLAFCEAAALPGIPVTLPVLAAYEIWYVLQKPNAAHPGEPHSVTSLPGIQSALRAAAREGGWCMSPDTATTFDGLPGYALSPADKHLLKALHKALAKFAPPRDGQKLPMRLSLLMLIWEWYDRSPTWERRRDRLWQALAHQGLLRVMEALRLEVRDVEFLRDERTQIVGARLALRETKTAQPGDAATGGVQFVSIPRRADAADAVMPLFEWMRERGAIGPDGAIGAGRGSDLIFPAAPDAPARLLSKQYVAQTLRAGLEAIGVSPTVVARYSGQSLRAGGATDMRDSGVPWHVIVMTGRWRSDAWKVYFRESTDVLAHLLLLRPVHLDALRTTRQPGDVAAADAYARLHAGLARMGVAGAAPAAPAAGPAAGCPDAAPRPALPDAPTAAAKRPAADAGQSSAPKRPASGLDFLPAGAAYAHATTAVAALCRGASAPTIRAAAAAFEALQSAWRARDAATGLSAWDLAVAAAGPEDGPDALKAVRAEVARACCPSWPAPSVTAPAAMPAAPPAAEPAPPPAAPPAADPAPQPVRRFTLVFRRPLVPT